MLALGLDWVDSKSLSSSLLTKKSGSFSSSSSSWARISASEEVWNKFLLFSSLTGSYLDSEFLPEKKIIKYQSNNEINKIPSVNKKSSNELWKDVFATSHEVESTSTISTLTLSKILQKLIIFKTKT